MSDSQAEYEAIRERYRVARKEAYEMAEKQLAEEAKQRRDVLPWFSRDGKPGPQRRWWKWGA